MFLLRIAFTESQMNLGRIKNTQSVSIWQTIYGLFRTITPPHLEWRWGLEIVGSNSLNGVRIIQIKALSKQVGLITLNTRES